MVSVQAMRAIAALSVMLVHFSYIKLLLSGGSPNDPIPLYPFSSGVDLFFVISGFVMVYSSEPLFGVAGSWRIFLMRRISRIVPLYWGATMIAIPIMSPPQNLQTITQSLLFIPYRTGETFFPTHAGGWTLNFEMFFYCVFAMAIFLPRMVAVSIVTLILISLVIVDRTLPISFAPISYWSDPIVIEFIFGMATALLYKSGTRLAIVPRIILIVFGAAVIWFVQTLNGPVPTGDRWLLWGVPAALILSGSVLGDDLKIGWLAGPIKLLGDASYALYLFHPMVGALIISYWSDGPFGIDGLKYTPMMNVLYFGACASIVLSLVLHLAFERRAQRFIRHLGLRAKRDVVQQPGLPLVL